LAGETLQPALAEIVGSSVRRATTRITKTARTTQDSWADNPDDTFVNEEAVRALLEGMEIKTFSEEERTDKPTAASKPGMCSSHRPPAAVPSSSTRHRIRCHSRRPCRTPATVRNRIGHRDDSVTST
jgi:hypothetical protein